MRHNHELAWWAGHRLADRWGVPFDAPEEMVGSMVTVPLPTRFAGHADDATALQAELASRGIEVPITATLDGFTTRISAQIYCDRDDIDHLASTVLELG